MKRLLLLGALLLAVTASTRSMAADAWGAWTNGLPTAWVEGPTCDPYVDYNCEPSKSAVMAAKAAAKSGPCDPYVNYSCLDAYLGDDVATRFFRYYQLEWGKGVAPSDPKAPPGRRSDADWPATPQSSPPMPFTEWPYGGTQSIGVTRPNSVDSPLMVAIANTQLGKAMSDAHIQVYGWVAPAGNISSNTVRPGGNAPAAYDYTPNTVQLDQAVVYVERLADTVQNDHFDWGYHCARRIAWNGRRYRSGIAPALRSFDSRSSVHFRERCRRNRSPHPGPAAGPELQFTLEDPPDRSSQAIHARRPRRDHPAALRPSALRRRAISQGILDRGRRRP